MDENDLKCLYGSIYGLTGIPGSGKSTIGAIFSRLGGVVYSADQLVSEIYSPEFPKREYIRKTIIEQILKGEVQENRLFPDGLLDRGLLSQVVFNDREKLQSLNKLIHPEVQDLLAGKLAKKQPGEIIIYEIPLLFENQLEKFFKAVIVAYTPEDEAIQRYINRTGSTLEAAKKRIRAQISIEQKAKKADYIINNTGDLKQLEQEVSRIWKRLMENERKR